MPVSEFHDPAEADPLQLLLVDHLDFDAQLIASRLQRSGVDCHLRRVETAAEFRDALRRPVDLVLSEVELPQFGAFQALELLQHGAWDVPLILVTASNEEELAVRLLQEGAVDYVLKDRMARLSQSVRLAVERSRMLRRLRQKQITMARLSLQLVQAQELERGNLARELHDELGQRLTALNMQLYRLQPEPASALLPAWGRAAIRRRSRHAGAQHVAHPAPAGTGLRGPAGRDRPPAGAALRRHVEKPGIRMALFAFARRCR